jgi:hypothetical protein
MEIRQSKITGYKNYMIETSLDESIEEIIVHFVEQSYAQNQENNLKVSYILPREVDL